MKTISEHVVNGETYQLIDKYARGNAVVINSSDAVQVDAGTNFNSLTTPGNYFVTEETAAGMLNIPSSYGGRLTVYRLFDSSVMQTYDDSMGERYWRVLYNSLWKYWQSVRQNSFELERQWMTRIESDVEDPVDFNDIITPGSYYVPNATTAETIENMPIQRAGRLMVYELLNEVVIQTYDTSSDQRRYWRVYNNSTWGDWLEHLSEQLARTDFLTLNRNRAVRVDSGDFDELRTLGNYYVPSATAAGNIANMPDNHAGRLTVMTLSSGTILQMFDDTYRQRRYWRVYNNSWGEWQEYAAVKRYNKIIEFETGVEYPYGQGFCVTDRYIYVCCIYDNTKEIVYKYDKFTYELKDSITFTGQIKHGNDFTWNPTNRKIYCAAGAGTKDIIVLDEDMTYESTITLTLDITSLSGVSYDPISGMWVVAGGDNHILYVLNNLTDTTPVSTIEYTAGKTPQGFSFYNSVIYSMDSDGKMLVLTIDGDEIITTNISIVLGEFEGIHVSNGMIVYNAYNSTSGKVLVYTTALNLVIDNQTLLI